MEYLEIKERRDLLGKELIGRLYFLPKLKRIILAPVYLNSASLDFEQDQVEIMPIDGPIGCEELGRKAYETLLRCDRKDLNLSGHKASDWEVYRASGAKSLRQFAQQSIRIELRTLPVFIEVQAWPPQSEVRNIYELGIQVRAFVNLVGADHELGTLILRLVRCCQRLHSDGLA
ncbi:hypothetical protein V5E97_12160 [Singulisphaera sp. Ch08]|uniref:Uncharacterized protein n=1 Tax=Singulisphaera sp. Ch08 TaxID=3120278 RepID=A0AAU7CMR6_9BACT